MAGSSAPRSRRSSSRDNPPGRSARLRTPGPGRRAADGRLARRSPHREAARLATARRASRRSRRPRAAPTRRLGIAHPLAKADGRIATSSGSLSSSPHTLIVPRAEVRVTSVISASRFEACVWTGHRCSDLTVQSVRHACRPEHKDAQRGRKGDDPEHASERPAVHPGTSGRATGGRSSQRGAPRVRRSCVIAARVPPPFCGLDLYVAYSVVADGSGCESRTSLAALFAILGG
jgi:hypothetical protein